MLEEDGFSRTILDAFPSPVFVVGPDVRIMDMNAAASRMLGMKLEVTVNRRAGVVLDCINSTAVVGGCGRSAHCRECQVRNSVVKSLSGEKVVREKARMQLVREGAVVPLYFLITTAPFRYGGQILALIIFEDISELVELRELLPICAWCGKIREDQSYWSSMEAYLKNKFDIDCTHGICPECAHRLKSRSSSEKSARLRASD
jgi:hypothetical protein